MKLAKELTERNCTKEVPDRLTPAFTDSMEVGWKKLTTTTWLKDILSAEIESSEEDGHTQTDNDDELTDTI